MALFLTQNLFVASGIDYLILSNPAIASLLQSWRLVGRVAELGSLGV